jgi:hypothetical protein
MVEWNGGCFRGISELVLRKSGFDCCVSTMLCFSSQLATDRLSRSRS